jgi:hypothetical protein
VRALSRGRLDYLVRKLGRARRGLVSSSAGEHRLPASRRRASYVRLLLGSRPPSFDGRIGLVESDEGHADGFGKAWSRAVPHIEIVRTPGDHYTYVVDEVDRVAEVLRRWLEEAETRPPAPDR